MKLVDKRELPSIDDIIAEIPLIKKGTPETKDLFSRYLEDLKYQYEENINMNLYDLNDLYWKLRDNPIIQKKQ